MQTTDYKITELFCVIDDFCKHFEAENGGKLLLGDDTTKRRRRKASLSDSEIMTILLYFHFGTFRNFKHYQEKPQKVPNRPEETAKPRKKVDGLKRACS